MNAGRKYWIAIFNLTLFFAFSVSAVAENEFSETEKKRALELIEQLELGSFAKRAAAGVELEKLPMEAVPWLEGMIADSGSGNVEVQIRLKAIASAIKRRDMERILRSGTQVKLDLKSASPKQVLDELNKQLGFSFTSESEGLIWDDVSVKDFAYEGSFWGGVDAMLEAYPPKLGARENLGSNYDLVRWGKQDFGGAGNASASNGILRVRSGRIALENSAGKDYLVVTLVPTIEPLYKIEALSLTIEGIFIGDQDPIEPENLVCKWEAKYYGERFTPGSDFTWVMPLKKSTRLIGEAKLKGSAKIRLSPLKWVTVDMPKELNVAVELTPEVTVSVLEREEDNLKIQLVGQGTRPAWFHDYRRRTEAFELLDKDGKNSKFNVRSTSSGGASPWRVSFSGPVEGDPAQVRARLSTKEKEIQLDFELNDLAMPGSSLLK